MGHMVLGSTSYGELFFSFLGYTIYCSRKENFFKSIKRIVEMYWGWQVGIDLYIGLLLPLLIIYPMQVS